MQGLAKWLFLAGRLLAGSFYIGRALMHFGGYKMMKNFAEIEKVPWPGFAVIGTGILLLFAGISILVGFKPRWGIYALVIFYVPVLFMMHDFWNQSLQLMVFMQMDQFTKGLGLLGSTLLLLAIPEPWPMSLDALLSRDSISASGRGSSSAD